MSDHTHDNDDVFGERVARVLRTPERARDDFEDSLTAAIRADRPLRRTIARRMRPLTPAWWAAPAMLRLSPVASLALAAGIAAVAVLGTLQFSDRQPAAPIAAANTVHDTVTFVRFVFVGRAKSVTLVGDFNRWGSEPVVLGQTANGAWTASVPLPNGRHEYAFIVDGERWVPDPLAPSSSDEFNTNSSVITVGT